VCWFYVVAGAKQSMDEAPYKLSRAIMKLASITFSSLAFSYWINKPWFLTEGKFATILIIPSSWGSQLGGHPARIIAPLESARGPAFSGPGPAFSGPPKLAETPKQKW
jgi:hypothetical protein